MSTIIIKNSSTAGAAPLAADLVQGELAVNVTSKALYTKNASAAVVKLNTPSIVDNGDATAITIDSSENVGIGTSSPTSILSLKATSPQLDFITAAASDTSASIQGSVDTGTGGKLVFITKRNGNTAIEQARIDSSGNLLVGTTSNTSGRRVNIEMTSGGVGQLGLRDSSSTAGKYWTIGPNSSNNLVVYNQGTTGVYITDGGTSWTGTSDERLKTNLKQIENGAAKVASLRAVTGRFKTDAEGVSRAFLIAQDVQAVLPEAVNMLDDEIGTLGLAYTDTIPLLVAAIQEQQALINAQQAALTTLTERITALEAK